jgi:hypothetical protein
VHENTNLPRGRGKKEEKKSVLAPKKRHLAKLIGDISLFGIKGCKDNYGTLSYLGGSW